MEPPPTDPPPGRMPLSPVVAAWIVEHADRRALGEFLAGMANHFPHLFNGFKASSDAVHKAPVRSRFASLLAHNSELPDLLLAECPGPWRDAASLLERWQPELVMDLWRPLTRLHGTPLIPAAMTQLSDPALVERGRRALMRRTLWEREAPLTTRRGDDEAVAALRLLARSVAETNGPGKHDSAAAPPDTEKTPKRETRIRKQLERVGNELREARDLAAQKQQAQENALHTEQKRARQAENELQSLQAHLEERVQKRLHQYRRDVLLIKTPNTVPDLDLNPEWLDHAGLLEQADRLLEQQARINEKHGTRSRLQRQLEETRERLRNLDAAAADSLSPHPEQARVRELLADHARRIEESLGTDPRDMPAVAASFFGQIRSIPADARAESALDAVAEVLEKPVLRSMVGPTWARELRLAIETRREYCATIRAETVAAQAEDPSNPAAGPAAPREIFDVTGELLRKTDAEVRMYVDGYNVLLEQSGDPPSQLAEARRTLEQCLRRHLNHIALVELVYDGIGSLQTREQQGNLVISFAPKRAPEQNADDLLVSRLRSANADGQRWLVTSDAELRARARPFCDAFVTAKAFNQFLRH